MTDSTPALVLDGRWNLSVPEDLMQGRCNWILLTLMGSRAYGIDTEESDEDWVGVYVEPLKKRLSVRRTKVHRAIRGTNPDSVFYDVVRFCQLAVKGNPTVLECLWHPDPILSMGSKERQEVGGRLLRIRDAFLSERVGRAYYGYICGQMARFREGRRLHSKGGKPGVKWVIHIVRLTLALEHLVEEKEILVRLSRGDAEFIKRIRRGEFADNFLYGELLPYYQGRAEAALKRLSLPEEPGWDVIDDFCYYACTRFED